MIFQSIDYLVFFLSVFTLYWGLPRKGQHGLLLIAGYVFYGYVHPWYGILLGATTLVDFTFTRLMEDKPERKRLWLLCVLLSNFAILAAFKYFGFFTDNILALLHLLGWDAPRPMFEMLLPAGVSFYTFQSCAYAVDVYRGQTWARRSLLDYAVYVSFFPQLVAGPIERADHLLSQFERPRRFDFGVARDALFLILWGLAKKRVIADTAAVYTNKAFSISDGTFPIIWAGVLCFCVQIYADFSAYTDIARGSARLLGFDLRQNFNHPWLAQSPADFWRRWHMSLSRFLRDYLYIPLGGSRCHPVRRYANLMITMLLGGLWHGAAWTYVIWGCLHGIYLIINHIWNRARPSFSVPIVGHAASVLLTFSCVVIAWVFFRASSLEAALLILKGMAGLQSPAGASPMLISKLQLLALILLVGLCWFAPNAYQMLGKFSPALQETHPAEAPPSWRPSLAWALFLGTLAALSFAQMLSGAPSEFIYFQF